MNASSFMTGCILLLFRATDPAFLAVIVVVDAVTLMRSVHNRIDTHTHLKISCTKQELEKQTK